MTHRIADSVTDGFATLTLASPECEAVFAPTVGMIGCSLRHRGAELLGQRGGLAKYASSGSTMGIPLLHPWANRLSGSSYSAAGRSVTLDKNSALLHRDANGLPMHGLLAANRNWRVVTRAAGDDSARLGAEFAFTHDAALLAAFPFPHTLALDIELRDATLILTTTLRPAGDVAVPASFGFHPYLQLPGIERAEWHIEAPVRRRLTLDARMIPTGASEPIAIAPGRLGERAFDDLFGDLPSPAAFVLAGGGRRITVTFESGYPFAQIYAPAGQAQLCFEPMAAPTNALVSGASLPLIQPGSAFRAKFSISVT